jgi:cytochrome P450
MAVTKADQPADGPPADGPPADGPIAEDGPRFGRAPGAWPLLGHFLALQRHPLRFLDTLADCGDLVEIRLGPRRAYMLCDPALVHRVLTDFRGFDRTGMLYDRVRDALGNGLATAAYRDHQRQRLIMQPAFRHEHLRGYAAVMQHEITAVMDGWREGACVDMVEEMFKLTMSVTLRALFSSQIGPRDAARLREAQRGPAPLAGPAPADPDALHRYFAQPQALDVSAKPPGDCGVPAGTPAQLRGTSPRGRLPHRNPERRSTTRSSA